ncbi:hypothetical protein V5O48_011482 [Marasmius crinis-equi]|uniref:Nephrocystin 3-like N-terminal domain-containing protein n=1 Tax=Marasmius crinis-equi TaxID=585013 RepID=A0ABR3F5L3_9AGAR
MFRNEGIMILAKIALFGPSSLQPNPRATKGTLGKLIGATEATATIMATFGTYKGDKSKIPYEANFYALKRLLITTWANPHIQKTAGLWNQFIFGPKIPAAVAAAPEVTPVEEDGPEDEIAKLLNQISDTPSDDDEHERLSVKLEVMFLDAISGIEASHKDQPQILRGGCLEGTRENVLRLIHDWRIAQAQDNPICWLSGTAGVGKSAIAISVAESYEDDGLISSFFLYKSDPKRNTPSALILTIARDLGRAIPSLRDVIKKRVYYDPALLVSELEVQFRELVLNPVLGISDDDGSSDDDGRSGGRPADILLGKRKSTKKTWWRTPNDDSPEHLKLIVIDGLDECGDDKLQSRILSAIGSSYQESPHFPVRFLICSRPEEWILQAFNTPPLRGITKRISLDDPLMHGEDIKNYYLREFEKIPQNTHRGHWPSEEEFELLVQKTCESSHFAYASTAVRFIKEPLSDPVTQLRRILTYNPVRASRSPFHEIDCLFHIIISAHPNLDELLSILAARFLIPPHAPLSPEFVGLLLGLTAQEIVSSLRTMHPLLDVRDEKSDVVVLHSSFMEYMFDQTRSGSFFIEKATRHGILAKRWVKLFILKIENNPGILEGTGRPLYRADDHKTESLIRHLVDGCIPFCAASKKLNPSLSLDIDGLRRAILPSRPNQDYPPSKRRLGLVASLALLSFREKLPSLPSWQE